MNSLSNININCKSNFSINFSGGDMTSDAGVALLKEFVDSIGFSRMVKDAFGEACSMKTYDAADLLEQKLLMLLCGYGTDDEADHLAHDPMFRLLLGKKRLASQPTMSRFATRLDEDSIPKMEGLNGALLRLAYKRKHPENIVLDVDTTLIPTYGKQEGGAYVYHYDAVGFHPIAAFDGLTGDLVRIELRKGNHYCGKEADEFLKPVLEAYNRDYPGTNVLLRGDSGFATPGLYDLAESYGYQYVIRLKQNPRLVEAVQDICDDVAAEAARSDKTYFVLYCEFPYQANSWAHERRVVCKIELHKGKEQSLFPDSLMFVVTNLAAPIQEVIAAYCKRGTMENFFKEAKSAFAFTHMSSRSFVTNANRLWIAELAYNIFNLFRRFCLDRKWKSYRAHELRLRLMKIAGRVTRHANKTIFKLCSSCPYQDVFRQAHVRILSLAA